MRRAGWWKRPVYRVFDESLAMEPPQEVTEAELCAGGVDLFDVEIGPGIIGETIAAMRDHGYEIERIER